MKFSDLKAMIGLARAPLSSEEKRTRFNRLNATDYPVTVRFEADGLWHIYAGIGRSQKGTRGSKEKADQFADSLYREHLKREEEWPALREKDRANWKSNRRRLRHSA